MKWLLIVASVCAVVATAAPALAANAGAPPPHWKCQITKIPGSAGNSGHAQSNQRGSKGHDNATSVIRGKCPCENMSVAAGKRCRRERNIMKEVQTEWTGGASFNDSWYAQP